jgi:hypothetical protein
MVIPPDEFKRTKQQPQNLIKMKKVIYNGMKFPSEQAVHEWRLIFEFDYFMEQAEQNLLIKSN